MMSALAAFQRGLATPPAPTESDAPDQRLAESVRIYHWQIRDLTRRLVGLNDPGEAARLHARITDARAKLDAAVALLPPANPAGGAAFEVHLSYPDPQGTMAVQAVLDDVASVGLLVADIDPEVVARVLEAARIRVAERLAALGVEPPVNAADGAR